MEEMKKKKKKKKKKKVGVDAYLAAAENALTEGNFDRVFQNLQKIFKTQPKHIPALELQSYALRDAGRLEDSYEVLQKCVTLAPNDRPKNWMALGELQMGPDALESFQRGIQIMTQQLKQLQLDLKKCEGGGHDEEMSDEASESKKKAPKKEKLLKDIQELERELSSAYVSIAELYTTDLCDEEKAEWNCEHLLKLAVSTCNHSAEAHRALSELRLVQSNTEKPISTTQRQNLIDQAIVSLESCLKLINDEKDSDEYQSAYDFKLSVVKLAMDLKRYAAAVDLIELILQEDDTVLETWYIAGVAYLRAGDAREAVAYLTRATEKYAKEAEDGELTDEEKVQQANVAMALREAQEIVKTLPPEEFDKGDDLDEDEDETMDTESLSNDFHKTDLSSSKQG